MSRKANVNSPSLVLLKFLAVLSLCLPHSVVATEASAICVDCLNSSKASTDLTVQSCEVSCVTNQCEQYFSSGDQTCKNHCASQTVFEKSAVSIVKCAKGATWNVAQGIVMTPISIWNAMVDSAQKGAAFVDFCESNLPCKRQLALEAAFLKKLDITCEPYSDDELKEVSTGDLIRKRSNARLMAERDQRYQEKLRQCKVPLPNLDAPEAPIDAIYDYVERQLKDLGIRWQCYNASERSEMLCTAIGSILIPVGVVKMSEQLAKFKPKKISQKALSPEEMAIAEERKNSLRKRQKFTPLTQSEIEKILKKRVSTTQEAKSIATKLGIKTTSSFDRLPEVRQLSLLNNVFYEMNKVPPGVLNRLLQRDRSLDLVVDGVTEHPRTKHLIRCTRSRRYYARLRS